MLNVTRSAGKPVMITAAGAASVKTLIDTATDSDELDSDESEDHTANAPDDAVLSDNDEGLREGDVDVVQGLFRRYCNRGRLCG